MLPNRPAAALTVPGSAGQFVMGAVAPQGIASVAYSSGKGEQSTVAFFPAQAVAMRAAAATHGDE
ncbi:MAG: hypothetical protein M3203_14415 [Actinomycetota bacterium]|nr:hypothetical protein [Actinomycetota bacterium]